MKNLINLIITFLVIIIGNQIAPTAIFIDSWKDAVFATLIVWGFGIVATIVVTFISALILLKCDNIAIHITLIIVLIVISIAITIGGFMLADYLLPSFSITTHALIVVAIVNGLLSVPTTNNKGE